MAEAWPGTIPQTPVLMDSYSEGIEDNRITFKPEFGRPYIRRVTTASVDPLTFETPMTSAEWTALKAFYKSTLKHGTLTFTRLHPRTGASGEFQFSTPPGPPRVSGGHYFVSMQVIEID